MKSELSCHKSTASSIISTFLFKKKRIYITFFLYMSKKYKITKNKVANITFYDVAICGKNVI